MKEDTLPHVPDSKKQQEGFRLDDEHYGKRLEQRFLMCNVISKRL